MFPFTMVIHRQQSFHVESIVLLSKLHTKQSVEVELEMSEMDLTAAESKATYAEIKQYVLDKYGLKVSSLNIAQIKAKCGIIERENYNVTYQNKCQKLEISREIVLRFGKCRESPKSQGKS